MNNKQFIDEFLTKKNYRNGYGHLLAKENTLWNYSTILCEINPKDKTAKFNIQKYSKTTTKIQAILAYALSYNGYNVTEYEGKSTFTPWNGGYVGASTYNKSDAYGRY